MNIPDHCPRASKQFFGLKGHKFFDEDPDPGSLHPGSGIRDGKIRIRGPGLTFPDPQHCNCKR